MPLQKIQERKLSLPMRFYKEKTRVLILSHFLINPFENNSAASTAMRNFLLKKVKKVVQIEQPFPDSKDKFSYLFIYENGLLKRKFKTKTNLGPAWFVYLMQTVVAFFFTLLSFSKYDLCIACENLSFFAVLPFRKLGLIKKLVYYSVDYVDQRFQNKLMNKIYHALDKFACIYSDVNWVVVEHQIEGRRKNNIPIGKCAPFRIVPIGFRLREINVLPLERTNYCHLMFCGTLRPSAGPQLIISALPPILKKFPKTKLTLVGGGEYKRELKLLTKKLGVADSVRFLGRVVKHKDLIEILTKGSIGFAPYMPDPKSLSVRSDPGKIKLYLACGLPVITTKVATSWPEISKNKAGLVIDFDEKELFKATEYLLVNKNRYKEYKEGAVSLSKRYDIDMIFDNAFKNL